MISYEISILHRGRRVSTTIDVWLWPWVLHDDLTGLVGNIKMQQLQSKSNGKSPTSERNSSNIIYAVVPNQNINNSSQNPMVWESILTVLNSIPLKSSHFPMMNLFDEFYPNINNSSQIPMVWESILKVLNSIPLKSSHFPMMNFDNKSTQNPMVPRGRRFESHIFFQGGGVQKVEFKLNAPKLSFPSFEQHN